MRAVPPSTVMREAARFAAPGAPIVARRRGSTTTRKMTMLEVLEDVLLVPRTSLPGGAVRLVRSSWVRQMPTAVSVAALGGWRAKRCGRATEQLQGPRSAAWAWSSGRGQERRHPGPASPRARLWRQHARGDHHAQGLVEISRLAVGRESIGGFHQDSAGMGDLVLTCRRAPQPAGRAGPQARQARDPRRLEMAGASRMPVRCAAEKLKVDVPICQAVYGVLYEGLSPGTPSFS